MLQVCTTVPLPTPRRRWPLSAVSTSHLFSATLKTKNHMAHPVLVHTYPRSTLWGRRDRDFLVQRSRFLAALKTRLGLILAKAVAMLVMINATGCPAPVLDRNRMNTHKHLSQLIESAIDHDIPTPV